MQRAAYQPLATHASTRGFTMVELMVAIAVAAILLGIGIPSMTRFIQDTRVSTSANEFIAAINMARSEAIKRGRLVTICRSVGAESGATECNAGNDWNSGWLVYVENSSATDVGVYNAGEDVIARQGMLPSILNVATNRSAITFNGTGEPIGGSVDAGFNFNADGQFSRQVCVLRSGRIKVIRDATACS